MTDRELMQQALDALEAMQSYAAAENKGLRICDEAIEALRARLAQPEPYAAQAAMVAQQTQGRMYVDPVTGDVGIGTVKPQREWQGLTDEEVRDLWSWAMTAKAERTANTQQHAFARAIEAKLKEKNHGG
jgi:hypothetical protein